jgi:predicted double-glycine peptidase
MRGRRDIKRIFNIVFFLAFPAFFLLSCSGVSVQIEKTVLINKVPFYPQEDYQCGPASLAGVMNYWGSDIRPEDIAKDIYSASARGTLDIDMFIYANKKGFQSEQYAGRWEDLKEKIDGGYPLVVLVDYGFFAYQANHFMVVVGYNEAGVTVNSGKTEHAFIEKEKFLRSWGKTNYWTLWIKKK